MQFEIRRVTDCLINDRANVVIASQLKAVWSNARTNALIIWGRARATQYERVINNER